MTPVKLERLNRMMKTKCGSCPEKYDEEDCGNFCYIPLVHSLLRYTKTLETAISKSTQHDKET